MGGLAAGQINSNSVDGRINTINTAVPFLRISPDARSGSMGDAGVAISPDANAIYWNQSKLPFASADAAVSVSYTPWLRELVNDVYLADLSGYKKLGDNQVISASLRYFSLGNIQFTDFQGNNEGQFYPREFAVDGGYSRKLTDHFSMGIALRYIYSNLASGQYLNGESYKAGTAVAGDVTAFYTTDVDYGNGSTGTWSFGAAITNMGSKISYTNNPNDKNFLPTNLGIGAAYTAQVDQYNKVTFAIDVNKLLVPAPPNINDSLAQDYNNYNNIGVVDGMFKSFSDPGGIQSEVQDLMLSFGLEYWYNNIFAVRAGYYNESKYKGDRKYFTLGLGLKYNSFGLNFSYLVPSGNGIERNPLSNTLRFSLLFDINKSGNNPATNASF
ncbi:MAG TPA: type IX secretion system outer membrane channel protein PorV [Chitinophagaceae bacterium]|nr:type IX secretion system outer membrane channel protein PorV [Chitinophagaceae bacterium]